MAFGLSNLSFTLFGLYAMMAAAAGPRCGVITVDSGSSQFSMMLTLGKSVGFLQVGFDCAQLG